MEQQSTLLEEPEAWELFISLTTATAAPCQLCYMSGKLVLVWPCDRSPVGSGGPGSDGGGGGDGSGDRRR